jgi:hypothetical protein
MEQSTPDLEDVQQQESEGLRVPVRLDGPVRVQVLPSRHGVSRSYASKATDPEPIPLLGGDDRRRRATLVAIGDAMYVGPREDVKSGAAALWPDGVPLVIEHTEQVYARAASDTATISVIAENWAD